MVISEEAEMKTVGVEINGGRILNREADDSFYTDSGRDFKTSHGVHVNINHLHAFLLFNRPDIFS